MKAEGSRALGSNGVQPWPSNSLRVFTYRQIWARTFKSVQMRGVSDEKSQDVQIHASSSKDFAGSLLDAGPPEPEVLPRMQPLLSVRQVAALLGVCAATVYRMCEQGELERFRVRNAIRVPLLGLKASPRRGRRRRP